MLRFLAPAIALALFPRLAGAAEARPFYRGVDANYSLGMEDSGARWIWPDGQTDLFRGMKQQGVEWLRVRLWTGDAGPNGREYATRVVGRAAAAGLNPYLVIFLSEDWADLMKQPLPGIWKGLSLEERASAVRAYARDTVRHFRDHGLASHLYEIGNEIDYGICGVYPPDSLPKDAAHLSQGIWPDAARLIHACQEGVKEADPQARFLLHIAHWWDADFACAFFTFMQQHGVQLDYAGLSYFPSSGIGGSLRFSQFGEVVAKVAAATGRPVLIAETGYPSSPDFSGQFGDWKKEAPGYPLTPEGQEKWLGDLLAFCASRPDIAGVFYWSPEWCGEGMWKAFALFDPAGNALPAWRAFAPDFSSGEKAK